MRNMVSQEVSLECPAVNDAGEIRVALASLVKMINLLGAELVVGRYREDIDVLESCIRAKLFAHVDGVSPEQTAAGVALAHSLIHPVLKNLRERVDQLHAAEAADAAAAGQSSPPGRLLN
jgi:hypothetical protein